MFRCITRKKVDTQIYSKTSMFIPLAYSERIAEFYRVVYRGASEVKIYKVIHTFVWFVRELVDNFKGMDISGKEKEM